MARFAAAVLILLITSPGFAEKKPSDDKVWVIVRPIQCLENPWEKAWLAKNPKQDAKYPRRREVELIKAYFAQKNVPLVDIRYKAYAGQGICQACSCSRGDTFYFLIHGENVPQMVKMGYTERIAAADIPAKKH